MCVRTHARIVNWYNATDVYALTGFNVKCESKLFIHMRASGEYEWQPVSIRFVFFFLVFRLNCLWACWCYSNMCELCVSAGRNERFDGTKIFGISNFSRTGTFWMKSNIVLFDIFYPLPNDFLNKNIKIHMRWKTEHPLSRLSNVNVREHARNANATAVASFVPFVRAVTAFVLTQPSVSSCTAYKDQAREIRYAERRAMCHQLT